MAFIRSKIINGKRYYYLVENHRVNGKVMQKVLRYIGTKDKLVSIIGEAK
ncbi:MAG: hypothetical protein V1837_07065 [Candidatus Woesearchaeota archaeon]